MTTSVAPWGIRRRVILIVILAFAFVVGVGVDVVIAGIAHRGYVGLQPQRQVEHYLDAIAADDIKEAVKLGRINGAGGEALLTASVYKDVPDRVSSYSIVRTKASASKATVTAEIRQGGRSYENSFTLHRGHPILGVIPTWLLDAQELPSIGYTVDAPSGTVVKIAGVTLGADDEYVFVLPGAYSVQLVGNAYYSAPDQTVDIGGFGLSGALHGQRRVTMSAALTTKGKLQAEKAVVQYLAGCLAQDASEPVNCPFALDPDPGATYTHNLWTLDQPVVSDFGAWEDLGEPGATGWKVSTVLPGIVDYQGDETSGPDPGNVYTDPFDFGIGGYIHFMDANGNATFVFVSSDYNVDGEGGGSAST